MIFIGVVVRLTVLSDEVFFRECVGEIAREGDLLNVSGVVDGDDVVCVVRVGAESRGFRDDDEVAVLGAGIHRNGVTLLQDYPIFCEGEVLWQRRMSKCGFVD